MGEVGEVVRAGIKLQFHNLHSSSYVSIKRKDGQLLNTWKRMSNEVDETPKQVKPPVFKLVMVALIVVANHIFGQSIQS